VGTEWLLDGRSFRIVRQLGPHDFIAEDLKFRIERAFSEQELLTAYAGGHLRFLAAEASSLVDTAAPKRSVAHHPKHLEIATKRWQAIEPLTRLERTPGASDFAERQKELVRDGCHYSTRSLRRWFYLWRRSGKDRRSLSPQVTRCGGRGKSRQQSWLRRFPLLRELVERATQEVYLTTARRPMSAVVRRVLEDLERHNSRTSATQALPVPRPSSLARTIARRIHQLDPYEIDRARWGRRIADQRHQTTTRQQLATRVLERVEIDHSPLKVVVGTKAGPFGQPWLTVLIDYYSRLIVGFCIGFEPPSYAVIMEALRQAILPKTYLRTKYPQLVHDWPCYGVPEKLVCDRGSDFTSNDLEQAAFQLGMELDFMPPRTPHLKGTVESFFDTLNDQLLSALPGRTFRSWEKRADYQPDDGPLLPYEALVEIIHRHLIDVYAQEKHPTAAKTRLEMWQESAAEFPPALPAAPDDLVVLLSKTVERALSVRGIELNGMFYISDELFALRAELAANNLPADKLTVRYNPWDLGSIWVLNPVNRNYLPAVAVDAVMQGLTEYQWRVLRRSVRERFDDPDHLLTLAAARNAIRDVVDAAVTKPTRRRRMRAVRFAGVYQKGPEQPPNNPPEPTAVQTTTSIPEERHIAAGDVIEINPAELNVDDWDVTS
jgi:putative transposase